MGKKAVHKQLQGNFGPAAIGRTEKLLHHGGSVVVRYQDILVFHLAGLVVYNPQFSVAVTVHTVHIAHDAEALEAGFPVLFQADDAEALRASIGQQLTIVLECSADIVQQYFFQHQVPSAHFQAAELFQNALPDQLAQPFFVF